MACDASRGIATRAPSSEKQYASADSFDPGNFLENNLPRPG
jgi:hypothetical protein